MTDPLRLLEASLDDGREIWHMLREFPASENGFYTPGHDVPFGRFDEFLRVLVNQARGIGLSHGYVPQITFWAMRGSRPVGICKVRHRLTDSLRVTGGHIGYGIRPSERGRGYATAMLSLAVAKAGALGIDRVLITVNSDNRASIRVVEKNRGILEKERDGKHYYWIATQTRPPGKQLHPGGASDSLPQ